MTLEEQQAVIRRALAELAARPSRQWDDLTRDWLQFALADHEDPDEGCSAEPGTDCAAVVKARKILAGVE